MFRGRIVRPGEPAWLPEDRDEALALMANDAATCHGCGQPRAESTDPANEYGYTAEGQRCHACAAIRRETVKFHEAGGDVAGVAFYVVKDG